MHSEVKHTCCSSREPTFNSQSLHLGAYNHLNLQFQEHLTVLASVGTCIHTHIPPHRHIHIIKNKELSGMWHTPLIPTLRRQRQADF